MSAETTTSIVVDTDATGLPVPSTLHGLFFEDINYAADGGLYAELLQNRSFEHDDEPYGWPVTGLGAARGEVAIQGNTPLNERNPHYLNIRAEKPGRGFGVLNGGFDGIAVQTGMTYRFSVYARRPADGPRDLLVLLTDEGDRTLARATLGGLTSDWQRFEATLRARGTATNAKLAVLITEAGSVDLDMVSLFPERTFVGRPNGLRTDLAQALADLKPGFLRFPGGCIAEGQGIHNIYRWKDTVGDIAERRQNYNLWRNRESPQYHQTYGLGFFEYFQLAEDLGAEPVPVVNCGMCCQARRGPLIPLEDLDSYVQDALDLIEFANGPTDSRWGALRAEMGHPKPFALNYLAVGNEQWGQAYFDRYDIFHRAIRERHPAIQIISSAGPFVDDPHWQFAWEKFGSGTPADVVDEHYYVPPRWLLENVDRYASYDRKGPHVFVGEFAAHDGNRANNLRSALAEAAYMTGLLRHADVVRMASYAPLLANVNHAQWRPDLIWFDNTRVLLTPNYHVQALFGQNRPEVVLPTTVNAPMREIWAGGKVGVGTWNTQAEYRDLKVVAADGQVLYTSNFEDGELAGWETRGGNWQVVEGALRQAGSGENVRAWVGEADWSEYTLSLQARKLGGQEGFLILFETTDIDAPVWWNLGGWRNTEHGLQGEGMPQRRVRGEIEIGRWYEIRVESRRDGVWAYLDGKLVQEAARKPVAGLFAVAGRRGEELVLTVVNTSTEATPVDIRLTGQPPGLLRGVSTVLTSADPNDTNSFEQPDRIAPITREVVVPGPEWSQVFEPRSLTVLRMGGRS